MMSKGQIEQRNHAIAYARDLYANGVAVDDALQRAHACYGLGRCNKNARLTIKEFEQLAFPEKDYGCP